MPEHTDTVVDRVTAAATDLEPLLARAHSVWRQRAGGEAAVRAPDWDQVFPSQFQEFTNRGR